MRRNKLISIICTISLIISCFTQVSLASNLDSAFKDTKNVYSQMTNLSTDYWYTFGAKSIFDDEFDQTLYKMFDVESYKQDMKWQATDYSAVILQLVICGENPYDYKGHDYVSELIQYYDENGFWGPFANPIWAGLALEAVGADGYDDTAYVNYSKAQLKNLSRGADLAGWSLILLSSHLEDDSVLEAVNTFKEDIKKYQVLEGDNKGMFDTGSLEGGLVELSTTCVISGLTSLGEDVTSEEWCIDGVNSVDALYSNLINGKKVINPQIAVAVGDAYYGDSIFKRITISSNSLLEELEKANSVDLSIYTDKSTQVLKTAYKDAIEVSQDEEKMSCNKVGREYFALKKAFENLSEKDTISLSVMDNNDIVFKSESVILNGNINDIMLSELDNANIIYTVLDGQIVSIGECNIEDNFSFNIFVNGIRGVEDIKSGDSVVLKYCETSSEDNLPTILVNESQKKLVDSWDIKSVKDNINLPIKGSFDTEIIWSSSNEAMISLNGEVTRLERQNVDVELTATITSSNTSSDTTFKVTVLKKKNGGNSDSGDSEEKDIKITFKLIGDTLHKNAESHNAYETWIGKTKMTLDAGATVYDAIKKCLADEELEFKEGSYGYISSIQSPDGYWLSEFDNGPDSGWQYEVSGDRPNKSVRQYILEGGDDVVILYVDSYDEQDETKGAGAKSTPHPSNVPTNLPTPTPVLEVENITPYTDVPAEILEYVNALFKENIIIGKTSDKLMPDDKLTRGEVIQLLHKLNIGEYTIQNPFIDISNDSIYYGPVLWAYQNKIILGGNNGEVRAEEDITYQDLVVILYRYTKLKGITLLPYENSEISIRADDYAKQAVISLINNGIFDEDIEISRSVTRGGLSKILYNLIINKNTVPKHRIFIYIKLLLQ